jgi:hypothetical protein
LLSSAELRATPREGGSSRVEFVLQREFQPGVKGPIAATVNYLGGRRVFARYLGNALKALEKRSAALQA